MNRLLFEADFPLDAQGMYSPESTLCECSEFYIVAPVSGADTRGGNSHRGMLRHSGRTPCLLRAAAPPLSGDNRPQTVRINIQPQREGAQAW